MMETKNKPETMSNRYKTDDGSLRWELITDILADICDGYLSNIEGIEYQNGGGADGLFRGLAEGDDIDVDPDLLGSWLLKSVSKLHSIAIDHSISGEPEDETLYRLSKFAPVASKLSDQYAMKDQMYQAQWHDDVLDICEAITDRQGQATYHLGVDNRHVNAGPMSDWTAIRANGDVVVIHEPGDCNTTAYTLGSTTRNPRAMATADAVLWEGSVGRTLYEDGMLLIQHPYAGVKERLLIDQHLDESVQMLVQTESVHLEGGGRVEFDCIDCGEHIDRERNQMDLPGLTPSWCVSCTMNEMGQ